jgi:hypothetical protein
MQPDSTEILQFYNRNVFQQCTTPQPDVWSFGGREQAPRIGLHEYAATCIPRSMRLSEEGYNYPPRRTPSTASGYTRTKASSSTFRFKPDILTVVHLIVADPYSKDYDSDLDQSHIQ